MTHHRYQNEAYDDLKQISASLAETFRTTVAAKLGCDADEIDMGADLMNEIIGDAAYDVISRLPADQWEEADRAAGDAADYKIGMRA